HKPFEADSFSEMCVKVAVDEPTPMSHAPQVQDIVMRCLAKTPDERYPSMADLARDLLPFAPNPTQAGLLVDRMERMRRRSLGDWEGPGTTTGAGAMRGSAPAIRRTPMPM